LKSLLAIVVAILMVFTVFLVITPAVATPNENANDKAKEHAKFQVPENKKEIAPGIFSLGKYEVNGEIFEGIMAYHHRENHNGGRPGNGNGDDDPPAPTNSCFSFLAGGLKWKTAEPWLVNPTNVRDLDESQIEQILSNSITKWENEAGKNILGQGTVTSDSLSAETANPPGPDDLNEVYFADISEPGVIGVTIIWVQTFPPGRAQIVEWDQVYDDVSYDWSLSGEPLKMDFENIATHELGHSVGMGHPDDDDPCIPETMYAFADLGETYKRDLHDGDIAGVQQLY